MIESFDKVDNRCSSFVLTKISNNESLRPGVFETRDGVVEWMKREFNEYLAESDPDTIFLSDINEEEGWAEVITYDDARLRWDVWELPR